MDWKDRVPTKPNRKKITFEDDDSVRYATVEYADEPTQDGTPLNKESFEALINDARPVVGTYTTDNVTSKTVNLGFKPRLLLIQGQINKDRNYTAYYYGMGSFIGDGITGFVELTDTGFKVYNKTAREDYGRPSNDNLFNYGYYKSASDFLPEEIATYQYIAWR